MTPEWNELWSKPEEGETKQTLSQKLTFESMKQRKTRRFQKSKTRKSCRKLKEKEEIARGKVKNQESCPSWLIKWWQLNAAVYQIGVAR